MVFCLGKRRIHLSIRHLSCRLLPRRTADLVHILSVLCMCMGHSCIGTLGMQELQPCRYLCLDLGMGKELELRLGFLLELVLAAVCHCSIHSGHTTVVLVSL